MKVYEIKLKVYTLKDIHIYDIQLEIASFIDKTLSKDSEWLKFHKSNEYKNYCFDSMYPLAIDKVYKAGNIYTITIRTVNDRLASYLNTTLANEYNDVFKGLTTEIRIIPKKFIEKIYSLTPVIIREGSGYWRENLSIDEFERKIKENLIKKYNKINGTKINEDFELYNSIQIKNNKPCVIKYKNIKLLGDKISMNISDDPMAQELSYLALGVGVGEVNARGLGFVNFRWL